MSRPAKPKPTNLTIDPKMDLLATQPEQTPPPPSSPMMNLEGIDLSSFGGDFTTPLISLPALPQSPPTSPRVNSTKDSSKTFLTNFKSRLTSEQDQRAEPPQRRQLKDEDEYRPGSSSVSKIYHLRKNPGSTPELSLVQSAESDRKHSDDVTNAPTPESKPQSSPPPNEDSSLAKRREKGGFRNPLSRTKSTRRDSNSRSKPNKQSFDHPPKTAPLTADWQTSAEMLLRPHKREKRGKSAERAIASESEDNLPLDSRQQQGKEKDRSAFVTGSKNVMNKAKTGGGNLLNRLGKLGRTGSHHERELPDSEYVFKIINMPLVEQTRITRISKDLSRCRDKTEYWMPSLPWRCIDYLNLNCESEGLYRVPGSGPQVKHWQRRFDTELDLDLLDEEELYDPNIISSMLKSWLRDLPTEIMPKSQQSALADELAKENPNYQRMGEQAPQKLRDALSELPPFNYYLLFAITCHLSLLLSHKDKNKMDLNNLSICIGPCLDLDRWLFNYLVGDWRRCWQGCFTEKQFLEAEKAYEQGSEYEMSTETEKEKDKKPSNAEQPITTMATAEEKPPPPSQKPSDQNVLKAARLGSTTNGNGDLGKPLLTEKPSPTPAAPTSSSSDENIKPDPSLASLPDYSQYVNGSIIPSTSTTPPERSSSKAVLLPPLDMADYSNHRPATAQAEKSPLIGGTGSGAATTTRPKLSTHSRSQSDVATVAANANPTSLAPIPQIGAIELPFKVRNE